MGHKVNPKLFRNTNKGDLYENIWYTDKTEERKQSILEDYLINEYLDKKIDQLHLGGVNIVKKGKKIDITLLLYKPMLVLGEQGKNLNEIKQNLTNYIEKKLNIKREIEFIVKDVRYIETNARLIAHYIGNALLNKTSYMSMFNQISKKIDVIAGVIGYRFVVKGRLGGATIARTENFKRGITSLSNLSYKVDYCCHSVITKKGAIGIKAYIFFGEK